jgi:DNA-binding LytR/AlgR family response regulator
MKVLIIEDENVAADKLEQLIHGLDPTIEIMAKIGSVKESVNWLIHHSVDLIFLDIQLSDGIGFSIFENVHLNTPIIFTTAYDQYAIKAFKLNSIAYLLKPIREKELSESLTKYKTLKSAFGIDFDRLMSQIQGKEVDYKKRFLIQIGDKIKKIDLPEIAYFYVFEKAVYLRTNTGNSYPIDYSLDSLEDLLDPDVYFRINRKYMVSIHSIANMVAYSRSRVKVELKPKADDEFDTIVSIERSTNFKKWLNR